MAEGLDLAGGAARENGPRVRSAAVAGSEDRLPARRRARCRRRPFGTGGDPGGGSGAVGGGRRRLQVGSGSGAGSGSGGGSGIGGRPAREARVGGYASGEPGDRWAPRGVLIAHLQEHRGPVRCLASASDGLYVVSGGDDGACKLWDCGRLERDVSFRSRLTYASQGGRVTALVSLDDDDRIVASASDNGSVHAWRVEYVERKGGGAASGEGGGGFGSRRSPPSVERYTGAAEVATVSRAAGAVTAMIRTGTKTLCYSTARGGIRGWDLRSPKEAFRVRWDPGLGVVQPLRLEHRREAALMHGGYSWSKLGSSPGRAPGPRRLVDLRFATFAPRMTRLPGALGRTGRDGCATGRAAARRRISRRSGTLSISGRARRRARLEARRVVRVGRGRDRRVGRRGRDVSARARASHFSLSKLDGDSRRRPPFAGTPLTAAARRLRR